MEEEIIACIADKHIKFLHSGQISKFIFPLERSKAHERGISHLIIRFFIVTITDDLKTLYLVQKRSKNKASFPGYYTDSASGHVKYRKNLTLKDIKEDAMRELKEEFGIDQKSVKYVHFYDLNAEKNKKSTEIAYTFIGIVDSDVILIPNKDELEESHSRFFTKEELKTILNDESSIDYSKKIWKKLINMNITENFVKNASIMKNEIKKADIALFLGRFQPLHHGHIYIINYIIKKHNNLKIGIGSSQISNTKTDPFTSEERYAFIEAALEKRNVNPDCYSIYNIPDIFNAQKWTEHVISIVGKVDTVYSNSDWVRELFINKGYKVGKKLGLFKKKYNGTNIRNLLKKNNKLWTQLVPKEVANLIIRFNGPERIRSLMMGD